MVATRIPTIALVGNPNTGKTTLFNALAGMKQRVGNYPGVTVEIKRGRLSWQGHVFEVVDLPGTYSLAPRSPDEMLAVELILGRRGGESRPDLVVTIVDASNLDRNLYLTTQVLDLGLPVVVALNMTDIARRQGITIDAAELSRRLGVPVVPIQANKGVGLDDLKRALAAAVADPHVSCGPTFPEAFEREAAALGLAAGSVPPYLVRRLLLDVGGYTEEVLTQNHANGLADEVRAARLRLADAGCPVPAVEARTRYAWIRAATTPCVHRAAHPPVSWTDRLDRVLTHKLWGTAIFLALMFVVFQSIFTWAKPFMDLIDSGKDLIAGAVGDIMSPGPLRSLLVDGVVAGVGSVLVFIPQIMILFAFIAVLEDCGYMARAAFLMDKIMSRCGLNGKSFIPLLSSVACAVPGIMATRVIENRRDRLATIVVAPLMSCSARLPVYTLLIGAFLSPEHGFAWWVPGLTLFGLYTLGLIVAPLVALLLKRTLLRGGTPVFVMEMPLYKLPSLALIWRRMVDSAWMFVRRAGTIILASMVLVWALLYFPSYSPDGTSFDIQIAEQEAQLEDINATRSTLEESHARVKEELEQISASEAAADRARRQGLAEVSAVMKQDLDDLDTAAETLETERRKLQRDWKAQSSLGRIGKALEPVVEPLGWDWRVGMAALASFPAREVFVGTMGIIYSQGKGDARDEAFRSSLGQTLRQETWHNQPGRKVFSVPVALSVMVFFALCCQCASTLAVIKRETNSWLWPVFTFVYMTVLAYLGALAVFQVGSLFLST
jgi:ferrous iron transport protein B